MLSFRIALRYLKARKSHNAVNIISMVSMAGVAVATAAMVCVLSVFNGFSEVARARLSMLDADLAVFPAEGKVIGPADSLAGVLRTLDGVAAVEPVIREQGLAVWGDRQMPVVMMGVTPQWRTRVSRLDSLIIDSDLGAAGSGATISVGVAVKLGARPDPLSGLELYVPRRLGRINPANPATAFNADTVGVDGVFQSQQSEYDNDVVIAGLDDLRYLLEYDGEASRLDIALRPDADADAVRRAVTEVCGPGLTVLNRLEQQQQSRRMIEIEKWISFVMLAFILLIASFNVVSTMSMLIIEKRGAMGVMRALGARPSAIGNIFFWQGLMISLVGGLAGLVLGSAATLAQQWGGFIKLGGDHSRMSISVYPVRLEPLDLLAVMAIVAAIGVAVALIARALSRRPAPEEV